MGITRAEMIRLSRGVEEYTPDIKRKMEELGIMPASPTFLKGKTPIDYCVIDGGKLENLTSDGAHRRCASCSRAYYFAGN